MVSVQEATEIILSCVQPSPVESIAIGKAVGRVLAEPLFADRDLPPFDRVTMDGIAIRFQQFSDGQRQFLISSVQRAGQPSQTLANHNEAIEVMTGAVLPDGTDTVIRYEDVTLANGVATLQVESITQGQNIHRRGIDATSGSTLLDENMQLTPAEIALLASCGKSNVKVKRLPSVAVVSTGDELVEIGETPLPHQIRRSNSYALHASLREMHIEATLYHLPDVEIQLQQGLQRIIERHDVIILSGGVSKGKFDYVPEVLEQQGIDKKFHQVSQRPGKPFWFGVSPAHKTVFALPGNPVSTYMCFYRYIKPWLLLSQGVKAKDSSAILATTFSFTSPLTYFLQVQVREENGQRRAYPVPGGGSGDFANLKDVDGFLELPRDRTMFTAGEAFPYFPFRNC